MEIGSKRNLSRDQAWKIAEALCNIQGELNIGLFTQWKILISSSFLVQELCSHWGSNSAWSSTIAAEVSRCLLLDILKHYHCDSVCTKFVFSFLAKLIIVDGKGSFSMELHTFWFTLLGSAELCANRAILSPTPAIGSLRASSCMYFRPLGSFKDPTCAVIQEQEVSPGTYSI